MVIAELTAGAPDDSTRKVYEAMRLEFYKADALIIPNGDDWLTASRILFWLSRGRKRKARGKTPPLLPGASQRMFMDALIAVSARRASATVVTEDFEDFKAIQYYCSVKLIRGSGYLDRSGHELTG